ncbi:MAG: 50S ribosomal protein L9 [bacterium]
MKVILQKDIREHGKKGAIVEVSDGYARNYLFPRKLAIQATPDALNAIRQQEKANARRMELEKAEALKVKAQLEGVQVKLVASAGANGKLFGSITSKEISDELQKQFGIAIEKNRLITEPIKTFGPFEVKAKLGYEVTGTVNVLVVEK